MDEATGSESTGNPEGSQESAPAAGSPATGAPQENASGVALNDGGTPHWLDGVQDPSTKAWAEAKGLKNATVENALGSYHNLEKMMGAEKAGRTVTLLGDDATPEERNEFYGKLGRPEAADKYSLQAPEGTTDTTRLDMMRNAAFDAGITETQMNALAAADAQYLELATNRFNDDAVVSTAEATLELKKDWGAAYDLKVAGIDVAAAKLGFTDGQLDGLRNTMGPVAAMKFVDGLNTKMGDHNYESGETLTGEFKTPEQAKKEMGELTINKEFMDAWTDRTHPGHKAAVEKKAALARLQAGHI